MEGGGPKKGAADPAQEAAEVSAETGVALATVCRLTGAPRSTVYARRDQVANDFGPPRRRGPVVGIADEELTEKIREVIRFSPFAGEGHRKVTARLRREHGIGVGRKRVLRLMRQAGLLAPQRARGRRKPRPHDGTIIPEGPNTLWGTDATMAYTLRDGWVWAFVAVDHHTAEGWASVAKRGDRFACLEPIYDAVRDRFGAIGPDVARGIAMRHDWGPQYTSGHFQGALKWLGDRRLPGLRGRAALQRLRRAVRSDPQGAVHLGQDLRRRQRAPGGGGRVRPPVQHPVVDRAARASHAARGLPVLARDPGGGGVTAVPRSLPCRRTGLYGAPVPSSSRPLFAGGGFGSSPAARSRATLRQLAPDRVQRTGAGSRRCKRPEADRVKSRPEPDWRDRGIGKAIRSRGDAGLSV